MKIITLIPLLILIFACSSTVEKEKEILKKIIEPNIFIEVSKIDPSVIKFGKSYDVEALPNAKAVSRAIFNKKDIEIREYGSHSDAVNYGQDYAINSAGKDAIVSGEGILWKEGAKDRRKCVPRAGNSEAGCDQKPRFGGYIILGNLIILCEGITEQESLTTCHQLKDSIIP